MQHRDTLIGSSPRRLSRHGVTLKPRVIDAQGKTVRFEDGAELDVDAVIWATGYRPDYSWLDVPVIDAEEPDSTSTRVDRSSGLVLPRVVLAVDARLRAYRLGERRRRVHRPADRDLRAEVGSASPLMRLLRSRRVPRTRIASRRGVASPMRPHQAIEGSSPPPPRGCQKRNRRSGSTSRMETRSRLRSLP